MVPAAGWANFDDHDLKLPELVCHLFQFSGPLDAPGILPQLVAEHVLQVDQIRPTRTPGNPTFDGSPWCLAARISIGSASQAS